MVEQNARQQIASRMFSQEGVASVLPKINARHNEDEHGHRNAKALDARGNSFAGRLVVQ
jgi:hypothetical protein